MLFDTWAGILPPRAVPRACRRADAEHRRGPAAAASRRAGHWLSAPGRPADRRICAATGVNGVGLDTVDATCASPRDAAGARGAAGQSRSAGAGRRRRGDAAEAARDPGRDARAAVRVQSRPRHRAADAARACRRSGGAGACRPKVAVVLFNLGGPDRPEAIRPFLLNLFNDPAILRVPFFVRPFLARGSPRRGWSRRRANYAAARRPLAAARADAARRQPRWRRSWRSSTRGASSPCAIGIRSALRPRTPCATGSRTRSCCCRCIRSIPPRPRQLADSVARGGRAGRAGGATPRRCAAIRPMPAILRRPPRCCARRGRRRGRSWTPAMRLRVLFSAHGLPEPIVQAGDPYQWQIEQTVAACAGRAGTGAVDWVICYQSRATPQTWLGPSTEPEIARAAHDEVAVLVVPIAFVSEHSETLVELDIDYRALAERLGVPGYFRVPTQNADAAFIAALAGLVRTRTRAWRRACAATPADASVPLIAACARCHDDRVPRPAVSLDQGAPHHLDDRLDGRHALSAAALRLPLRGAPGLGGERALQGDGATAAASRSSIRR